MPALRPSADLVGEDETTEDLVWPDMEPGFRDGRTPGSVAETGLGVFAVLILSGGREFCPGTTSGAFLELFTAAGLPGRLAEALLVGLDRDRLPTAWLLFSTLDMDFAESVTELPLSRTGCDA